eukprot:711001-Pelagomonas_calceolata.AAC.5
MDGVLHWFPFLQCWLVHPPVYPYPPPGASICIYPISAGNSLGQASLSYMELHRSISMGLPFLLA